MKINYSEHSVCGFYIKKQFNQFFNDWRSSFLQVYSSDWKGYRVSKVQITFISYEQATAGGGGRGMRLANEPGEFVKLLQVPLVASLLTL